MKTMQHSVDVPIDNTRKFACPRLMYWVGIAILPLLLSGCFFRSLVGFVDDRGGVSLSGNVEASFCDFDTTISEFFGCNYTIRDSSGRIIELTSTFELFSEFGFAGLIIDPLILQLPSNAKNLSGIYNNAGFDQSLIITLTDSFPVQPGQMITAEAGTQFAILELPDTVAIDPNGQAFDFALQFDVPPGQAPIVKPMLTARADIEGTRYFTPVFPCVTDFAQIPQVQIPSGDFFQDLRVPLADIINGAEKLACNEVIYNLDDGGPAPKEIHRDRFETATPQRTPLQ